MYLAAKLHPILSRAVLQKAGFGVACAVIAIVGLASVLTMRKPSKQLQAQIASTAEIVSHLEPGDSLFIHGQSEILVLSGLTNARKYTNLDHGKDGYLDRVEPGGFNGWFEQLQAERPKVVVVTRSKNLDRKRAFSRWVRTDYEKRQAGAFTYYLRIDQ